MKVALCLSGQTRNWMGCRDTIKKYIIEPLNADVFFHTWSVKGEKLQYHTSIDTMVPDTPIVGNLEEFYKPILSIIEVPNYNEFKSITPTSYYNTLMMHYSIWKANELKKVYEDTNGMKYDLVIRCRFDLEFHKFDIVDTLPNIVDTIYLPPNQNIDVIFPIPMQDALKLTGISYMPNDQFGYGSSDGMDYYSKIWEVEKSDMNVYMNHPEGSYTDHFWNKNTSKFKVDVNPNIHMKIFRG
jgi:hypothetical protein